MNRSDEYIRNSKLEEVCPKRKYRNGRPKITRNGVTVDKEKRWNIWYEPEREPNELEKRLMLKESLKIALETLMTNHTYKFDEVIRKQKEGGAIGSDLTGEMARIFMCWWDRKIIEKMNHLGIKVLLYKRYVDDINMIIEYLEGRFEYEEGRIVEKEGTEEVGEEEKDQMMFRIVRDIGNEIHKSIQLTTDTPSENADNKVPILDLKCWVGEGIDRKERVLYEHYMKNMASRLLVHRQSAMSIQSKRTILTQQCLRVMLNCSEHIDEETKNGHLSYFMARMQSSGYDHEFRLEVLKSAKIAYSRMKEKESQGEPMHRSRTMNRDERKKGKAEKRKKWYDTTKYEATLFVPATPGSELQKRMQGKVNESGVKLKVIERSGEKLIRMVQKNDPFKKKLCSDPEKCLVCRGGKPGGCRASGITYRIDCEEECSYEYTGQTNQNAYSRGKVHMQGYGQQNSKNPLWKHSANVHGGDRIQFSMKVIDRVRNDSMKRQILEAVRMQRVPESRQMNSKSEWRTTKIPRITVEMENNVTSNRS